jgi:hypothetical protein
MNRVATRARQQQLRRRRTMARRQATLHTRQRRFAAEPLLAPRGSTLLALVQEVQRCVSNDAEVIRVVRWLVNSGTVVLTGSFAGRHF